MSALCSSAQSHRAQLKQAKLLCALCVPAAGEVCTLSEDRRRDETFSSPPPLVHTYIKVFHLNYFPLSGLGQRH